MQSVKLMVLTGIFSLSVGVAVAAPSTALPKAPESTAKKDVVKKAETDVQKADASEPQVDDETQLVQDRLAEIVEDDFTYEKERRKLANQVELEKMLSQIRKLRGEDKKGPAPVQVSQPANESKEPAPTPSAPAIVMPRVLFEAEIGGSQRTAVSDGNELRYVRRGEVFSIGGNDFKLAKDRKSVVLAKDAIQ